jgi:hypothetical protein
MESMSVVETFYGSRRPADSNLVGMQGNEADRRLDLEGSEGFFLVFF